MTLSMVRQQRWRILHEISAVMHDSEASKDRVNLALRFYATSTRLLADVEKSVTQQERRRGEQLQANDQDAIPQETLQEFRETPADSKKSLTPEIATPVSRPSAPSSRPSVATANSPLPAILKQQLRHRPLEMNEKEFAQYLARLEAGQAAAQKSSSTASPHQACAASNAIPNKELGNGSGPGAECAECASDAKLT